MAKKFLWRPISITPTKAGTKTKIYVPQPEFKALQLNKRDVVDGKTSIWIWIGLPFTREGRDDQE